MRLAPERARMVLMAVGMDLISMRHYVYYHEQRTSLLHRSCSLCQNSRRYASDKIVRNLTLNVCGALLVGSYA